MHQPKVVFNKKILQPKLDVQQRIKNSPKERRERERERERVCTYLCGQNIDKMEERKENIYSKKNEKKKSQNKRNMKGWRNCKIKVKSSREIKS